MTHTTALATYWHQIEPSCRKQSHGPQLERSSVLRSHAIQTFNVAPHKLLAYRCNLDQEERASSIM